MAQRWTDHPPRRDWTFYLPLLLAFFLFAVPLYCTTICSDPDNNIPTVTLDEAVAVTPATYPDGSINPDYKDQAIAVLQVALDRMMADYDSLHARDVQARRGACVRWE